MSVSNDGSESVDQFLARVASLSRRNDEEVAERNRKMEEEMMQARKQRRARREERARSLSPVKTGPAAAPTTIKPTAATATALSSASAISSTPPVASIKPPVVLAPRPQSPSPSVSTSPSETNGRLERSQPSVSSETLGSVAVGSSRPLPPPPVEKPATPTVPPVSATTLSRSGTLSWQQRPLSRDGGTIRNRPLSTARAVFREPTESVKSNKSNEQEGTGNARASASAEPEPEPEPSRAEIAASLATRDPSWFRQTPDRGIGSPAYRKSREDSGTPHQSTHQSLSSKGVPLPGMVSQSPKADTDRQRPARALSASPAPTSPGLAVGAGRASPAKAQAPTLPLSSALASSPEPESSPRTGAVATVPPAAATPLNRTASVLGSQPRAPSPTKGLGGFVQSAMMKRSDSVSKRWSVQSNGLKRGDSVAGNRPLFNPTTSTSSLGQPTVVTRDSKLNTDGSSSPLASSRPTSLQAAVDVLSNPVKEDPLPGKDAVTTASSEQPPDVETKHERPVTPSSEILLSRSPSKTADSRRWSPTKASWLESALAKPDSPRPPSPVKAEIPAWKVGLERSRSQRRPDASPTRSSNFDSVATTGLLRQPPIGSVTKTPESLAQRAPPAVQAKGIKADNLQSLGAPADPAQSAETAKKPAETAVEQKLSPDRPSNRAQDPGEKEVKPVSEPVAATKDTTPADGGPLLASTDKQPPAVKPKPQTPPKLDFRSTLRSRQVDSKASKGSEPEFKAVFGKLKPTQTQNYVAPDIFKQNITQGKAALAVTGGPQKTKRVDDFKESILSRKEEMKAGGGSIHKQAIKDSSVPSKEPEIPEALARRKTLLHKTKPSVSSASSEQRVEPPKPTAPKPATPVAATTQSPESPKPEPKPKPAASAAAPEQKTEPKLPLRPEATKTASLGLEQEKPLDRPVSKAAPSSSTVRKLPEKPSFQPSLQHTLPTTNSSPEPDRGLTKTTSNKLAARLNPALAGLIARGSSGRSGSDAQSTDVSSAVLQATNIAPPESKDAPDGSSNLTHMTKARAKGPRRRAPKAEQTPAKSTSTAKSVDAERAETPETKISKPAVSAKLPSAQTPVAGSPKAAAVAAVKAATVVDGSGNVATAREKPRVASKSSELRKVSEKARIAIHQSPPGHSEENAQDQAVNLDTALSPELAPSKSPRPIVTPARSPEKAMPLTPSKTRLNTPKVPDPVAVTPVLKPTPKTGLGFGISVAHPKPLPVSSELTPPPEKEGRILPESSVPSSDVEERLVDAFGAVPRAAERLEFDTEAFLKAHSTQTPNRIRTTRNTIVKVTGDGKQSSLPPSQEHILNEDSMYLSVHKFECNGSPTTEVYLWKGDAVPEAAVEDAQIFCRKVARDNDTKLQVISQGMESATFLSGLGGILIVRKSRSSDLYMLCGRRHGGHIVFDQVELSPTSLCSGFSYLISAQFGKLYLWIGAGSCADEYGAARLIGTDLGLTGEIEEVTEGKEPAAFWNVFSSPAAKVQFQPSKTWALRAGNEHRGFPCKLYRIEQERPKSSGGFWGLRSSSPPKSRSKVSVQEIDPFSQQDLLKGDCVHLLDTYAALYVIPGKGSPSKSADFVSTLHIAQELAVLAPSIQDRALLPSCHVAFGEPPRDCQAAFRKWSPGKMAGDEQRSACYDLADVMRVLT